MGGITRTHLENAQAKPRLSYFESHVALVKSQLVKTPAEQKQQTQLKAATGALPLPTCSPFSGGCNYIFQCYLNGFPPAPQLFLTAVEQITPKRGNQRLGAGKGLDTHSYFNGPLACRELKTHLTARDRGTIGSAAKREKPVSPEVLSKTLSAQK